MPKDLDPLPPYEDAMKRVAGDNGAVQNQLQILTAKFREMQEKAMEIVKEKDPAFHAEILKVDAELKRVANTLRQIVMTSEDALAKAGLPVETEEEEEA